MQSRKFKVVLFLSVIIFAAIAFMASPYFAIAQVTVDGCNRVSQNEILSRAGTEDNTNIFLFNSKEAKKNISQNLYIDHITIEKKLPGTLTITVKERNLCGYVEYLQGKYLYIDDYGRVLEVNTYFTEKFPIVSGLSFDGFMLGDVLEVEDKAAFKSVVQMAWLFDKHQMADLVSRIDVSDTGNTKIHIHNIEYNVGDGKNADEKIRTIKEIIIKLPNAETIRGFVDLKEIGEQYVLKIVR